MAETHFKHPPGMWYFSFVSTGFCYALGTVLSLLVLYLTQKLHFDQKTAYSIFAAFMSLMYILPLLGGYVAGQFGYKKALVFSIIVILSSLIILHLDTKASLYAGLGLFALAHGFYMPNINVLLSKLYAKDDNQRDSGFTFYYALFNIGLLLSSIIAGYVQVNYGFYLCFIIAVVPLIIILVSFPFFLAPMKPHKTQRYEIQRKSNDLTGWLAMIVLCIIASPICIFIMSHATLSKYLILGVLILTIVGVLALALYQKDKGDTLRLFAYLILALVSTGFWSLFMLAPSLLTLFIKNNVNRTILGSLIPAASFYGLNPLFVILFGALFGMLWFRLAQKGKDLTVATKFSLSLFSMCIAFSLLFLAVISAGTGNKIGAWWIVIAYFFLSSGELLISPIGLGVVGRLSPKGLEGLLMGAWLVFRGGAATISSFMAGWAIISSHTNIMHSDIIYEHAFLKIAAITLCITAVALLLLPFLKRTMHQENRPLNTFQTEKQMG